MGTRWYVRYVTVLFIAYQLLPSAGSMAQGMRSVQQPIATGTQARTSDTVSALGNISQAETITIQRLLRRLGYLREDQLSRTIDAPTLSALLRHFSDVNLPASNLSGPIIMRSLFSTAWKREGWDTGAVNGQTLVDDPKEVHAVQTTLKKIGYAPGPLDGVFGPATLSSVEAFQEDNGMTVSGLLTRNTVQAILRANILHGKETRGTVRMLNWPDYIDPAILEKFEQETQIKVIHEVFENSSETRELLQAGSSKYDVMVQQGNEMNLVLAQPNTLAVLDGSKLPNLRYLDPTALQYTSILDPNNLHSIPYMWGTVGIAVNKAELARAAPDAPFDSMALLLNPQIAAKVAKCGIAVVDEPVDVVPAMIAYLGGNMQQPSNTDFEILNKVLISVAPYIEVIPNSDFIDAMSSGKYCVAIGYSGDVFVARDDAEANGGPKISYHIPVHGSQLWFDLLVIPAHATNLDEAYQLVDFLNRPEIAGANTNFIQYANANLASASHIEPALLKDPGLYPPQSVLEKLAILPPLSQDMSRNYEAVWATLKRK